MASKKTRGQGRKRRLPKVVPEVVLSAAIGVSPFVVGCGDDDRSPPDGGFSVIAPLDSGFSVADSGFSVVAPMDGGPDGGFSVFAPPDSGFSVADASFSDAEMLDGGFSVAVPPPDAAS